MNWDASIKAFSAVRTTAFENADVSAIFLKGSKAPETLNEEVEFRYRLLLHNIFLSFWHVYSQSRYAELPGDVWEVQEPSIVRVACSPGGKWFWENHRM